MLSDSNKQDSQSVLSHLDVLLSYVSRDLPRIRRVVLLSDGARCYRNAMTKALFPVIARAHDLTPIAYLHCGVQDGKSQLDASFSTAMKQVCRFVSEGHNAVTPAQLVIALQSNGGLSNTRAILLSRDQSTAFSQLEATHNSRIRAYKSNGLGEASLLEYSFVGEKIRVSAQQYAGFEPSVVIEGDQVVSGSHDIRPDDDDNGGDAGFLSDNEVDDSSRPQSDGECDDDDNIADASVLRRSITGVTVRSQSYLRRLARKWVNPRISSQVDDLLTSQSVDSIKRTDAVSIGLRYAIEKYRNGRMETHDARQSSGVLDMFDLSEFSLRDGFQFTSGWAQRPRHGQQYGVKYINAFQKDIEEMFNAGEANSGQKMSPGGMLESLLRKYPSRYDIPQEDDIRSYISVLMSRAKRRTNPSGDRDAAIAEKYEHAIKERFESVNGAMMPRHGIPFLQQKYPEDGDDIPDQKHVKAFISALRKAARQQNK